MPIEDWSDEIVIAELHDEPSFSEDMDSLTSRVEQMTSDLPDVILNVQAVSYLNSSNIAQMLKLRKRVLDGGGRLRVCSIDDRVWSVMLATGLDNLFSFNEDVATALASLQLTDG